MSEAARPREWLANAMESVRPEYLREVGALPGRVLWLTDPVRAGADAAFMLAATPWLAAAPNGDGHGVLVLPGLLAGDASTFPLRTYLKRRGYEVRGWRLGRNLGPTKAVIDTLPQSLHALAEETGGPVSLIGWSMGGIFARYLALTRPEDVRRVVTLGSPFGVAHGHRTRADAAFAMLRRIHAERGRAPTREEIGGPIRVPSTSIYSRRDGIVPWRACLADPSPRHQNIEVRCAHLGYGHDAATMWAVADRLAVRRGDLTPFDPPVALRMFYGRIT